MAEASEGHGKVTVLVTLPGCGYAERQELARASESLGLVLAVVLVATWADVCLCLLCALR